MFFKVWLILIVFDHVDFGFGLPCKRKQDIRDKLIITNDAASGHKIPHLIKSPFHLKNRHISINMPTQIPATYSNVYPSASLPNGYVEAAQPNLANSNNPPLLSNGHGYFSNYVPSMSIPPDRAVTSGNMVQNSPVAIHSESVVGSNMVTNSYPNNVNSHPKIDSNLMQSTGPISPAYSAMNPPNYALPSQLNQQGPTLPVLINRPNLPIGTASNNGENNMNNPYAPSPMNNPSNLGPNIMSNSNNPNNPNTMSNPNNPNNSNTMSNPNNPNTMSDQNNPNNMNDPNVIRNPNNKKNPENLKDGYIKDNFHKLAKGVGNLVDKLKPAMLVTTQPSRWTFPSLF